MRLHVKKHYKMKKETFAVWKIIPVILVLLIYISSGCKKGEGCKTCKAKNTSGTVIREEQVCNVEQENNFRDEYSGHVIECN